MRGCISSLQWREEMLCGKMYPAVFTVGKGCVLYEFKKTAYGYHVYRSVSVLLFAYGAFCKAGRGPAVSGKGIFQKYSRCGIRICDNHKRKERIQIQYKKSAAASCEGVLRNCRHSMQFLRYRQAGPVGCQYAQQDVSVFYACVQRAAP